LIDPSPTGRATTRFVADRSVRRYDNGRLIVGGSPLVVQRLTDAGAALLTRVLDGEQATSPNERALVARWVSAGLVHPVPAAGDVDRSHWFNVTVVIPTRNDDVAATVASVGPVGRIVIVDDGSTIPIDEGRLRACAAAPLAVIRRERPGGPAAARNDGLLRAETELVAFVDADVVVGPYWLDGLLAAFADPKVGVVAPRIRSTPGDRLLDKVETQFSPLDLGGEPARVIPFGRVSYLPTACLIARRDALVDGFDVRLRFGEDVDAVWRAVDAGWTVRYEPSVVVHHHPRSTWSAWFRQRRGYGSAAAPLGQRHPGRVAPAACHPLTAMAWLLIGLGWPLVGTTSAAAGSLLFWRSLASLPERATLTWQLAVKGQWSAGVALAEAVRRAWWPLVLPAALCWKRARLLLAISVAAAWWGPREPDGMSTPMRGAVRVVDDAAYSVGVWQGILRVRSLRAVVPRLRWKTNMRERGPNRAEPG
jgi:mycofactocin glycosyltransferase